MKVVLDTNFLMAVAQFKIDIFSEIERIADFKYELCVLSGVLDELDKVIDEQKGKDKEAAKIAKQLVEHKNLVVLDLGHGLVDDLIVGFSEKEPIIVATQDTGLIKRLKSRIIRIRKKNHLEID